MSASIIYGANGGNGDPVYSLNNAQNTHNADVHNQIINNYLHQHTGISTTLAADTSGDGTAYKLLVLDAAGFANFDYLHINTTSAESTHAQIVSSVPALPYTGPAVFTLDRRLDKAHSVGDTIIKAIVNMALQDGTIDTPQYYFIGPPAGKVWHLTRILFEMTHDVAGDLGKFGGVTALVNGMVLRARNDGQWGTLTNWKRNGDIKTDMFDVVFDDRSGGGGAYGTSGRGTFTEAGAVLRLDGDKGDIFQVYHQDVLTTTSINTLTIKVQGHYE
jgi:hypothetical protein